MQKKKIQYYDSFGGGGSRYLEALLQYFEDEHKAKGYPGTFDRSEWTLVETDMATTPQQQNGYDCGVFACTAADFLSVGVEDLPYDQSEIREQRLRFVHKITSVDLEA